MKKGYLSEYFKGVACKYLSAVEVQPQTSHQHEFNGVSQLKTLFGVNRREFKATFLYMQDDDDEPIKDNGTLTWYDARENHPTRSEHRLYFSDTMVSLNAEAGDLLVIALRPDETLLVIVAEKDSTIAQQILWLFDMSSMNLPHFSVKGEVESDQVKLEFAARYILEQIGVEQTETDESLLDVMLRKFNGKFPPTKDFSAFARETLRDVQAGDNPDALLLAWMEREEILFRTLEKHFVGERLDQGFCGGTRIDDFLKYSLSVQNRRKARAGSALENHLEFLLRERGILYSRAPETEGKAKPDFLFPGIDYYRNLAFPSLSLTMLGVKTTCKDRWRQILVEADRIREKHLLTLEPGISRYQTDEMKNHGVRLVLPQGLHETYSPPQREELLTLSDFFTEVTGRQKAAPLKPLN